MEINVTSYFLAEIEPSDFSGSVLEKGENAGKITFNNALEESESLMLLDTDEKIEAVKQHFISMGMEEEEINACSNVEINATFLQLISGDIREGSEYLEQSPIDWVGYENDDSGQLAGNLFKGIDNEIYYYVGS